MKGPKDKEGPLVVPGINPVEEAMVSYPDLITEIWTLRYTSSPKIKAIMERALLLEIPFRFKEKEDFQRFSNLNHQGIVAFISNFPYKDLTYLRSHTRLEENPVVLALDHITDEGNLGSIIRSACFFGIKGIILPKDRSAKVSPTVIKRSSGACMKVSLVRVTNLHMALRELKEAGYWVMGTVSKGGLSIYELDLIRPLIIVMGSESKGMSPVLAKIADVNVTIPGKPQMDSLNVSVAAGIILSEIQRQRLIKERN